MSNTLAVAAVTAVLKDLLASGMAEHQVSDILGRQVVVSSLPPDMVPLEGKRAVPRLNLFLYQVTPNPGLINVPMRNVPGGFVSQAQLALQLHYLLTAYGTVDLETEILLGYGMQRLHDHAVLSRETIRESLTRSPGTGAPAASVHRALAGFAEQMETVSIASATLAGEEMWGVWSALQARYRPSAGFEVSVVLGEPATATDAVARRGKPSSSAMGAFATRVAASAKLNKQVLAEPQQEMLRHIVAHMQGPRKPRSKGASAKAGTGVLLAGGRGTDIALAAEVLARELQRELYRVNLAAVASKYIGETEKNLRVLFENAEKSGAILLFDEADALFGKRTKVKDSHDRYANIEVSYLLQRIESFNGLAIFTSNVRSSLDAAFLRGLRFVVEFPIP